MSELYRCGWCGNPCDKGGKPLGFDQCNSLDEEDYMSAEPVNGECCPDGNQVEQERRVTREMALDACDPSLEGRRY